jgi:translation initiation factor 3 subunit H
LLTSIPVTVSSPSLINAFLTSLTTSPSASEQPSLTSPSVPLPPSFSALSNPLGQSLPAYLSDTLDALTLQSHEANNIRHEQSIRDRDEENLRRRKGGLPELPAIPAEMRNGTKDPSRLELLCLQGQVDGLAKGMGAEAGKGLVRCYL